MRERERGAHRDVVRWHGLQVALEGLPPFRSGLEFVHSNQVIYRKTDRDVTSKHSHGTRCVLPWWHFLMFLMCAKVLTEEGQHHGVVVGHDEEVDTGERCARLQVAERLAELAVLGAVAYVNLNITSSVLRSLEYVCMIQVVRMVCDLGDLTVLPASRCVVTSSPGCTVLEETAPARTYRMGPYL